MRSAFTSKIASTSHFSQKFSHSFTSNHFFSSTKETARSQQNIMQDSTGKSFNIWQKGDLAIKIPGLRGLALETELCRIVPEEGMVYIRDKAITELAGCRALETMHFIKTGNLPSDEEVQVLQQRFAKVPPLPEFIRKNILNTPKHSPMSTLGSAISSLNNAYPHCTDLSDKAQFDDADLLLAKHIPEIIALIFRHYTDQPLELPSYLPDHYENNFFRLLHGRKASDDESQAMAALFLVQSEHGFSASIFTTLQCASSLPKFFDVFASTVFSLSGRLHGGGNEEAMKIFMQLSEQAHRLESKGMPWEKAMYSSVQHFLNEVTEKKRKVPGFGHAVYGVVPEKRATIIEAILAEHPEDRLYQISACLEKCAREHPSLKKLPINVDYRTGPLMHRLGIPSFLYPLMFAGSIIPSATAHLKEALPNLMLGRPTELYKGKLPQKEIQAKELSTSLKETMQEATSWAEKIPLRSTEIGTGVKC